MDIRITAEPVDSHRCKFVASTPLLESGARHFASPAEAAGSPLAEAILALPNVTELLVAGHAATVTKSDTAPWQGIGRDIGAAIRAALASGAPLFGAKAAAGTDDDALYDRVAMIFDTRINPMVASHGGRVDLIDVQDGVVLLRLMGGCQGCGMASVTLRNGIEATLRQLTPEVRAIVDVTDHAAGVNPYYASAK